MTTLMAICGTIIAAEIIWIIKFICRDVKKLKTGYQDWGE